MTFDEALETWKLAALAAHAAEMAYRGAYSRALLCSTMTTPDQREAQALIAGPEADTVIVKRDLAGQLTIKAHAAARALDVAQAEKVASLAAGRGTITVPILGKPPGRTQ